MNTGQGRLPQLGMGVSVGGDSVFNEGFLQEMSLLFSVDSLSKPTRLSKKKKFLQENSFFIFKCKQSDFFFFLTDIFELIYPN